jgi:hypothetical protein
MGGIAMRTALAIILVIAASGLTGCSVLSIGADESFAEEYGYDLQDAGVLWHPYIIIQDKQGANEAAYKHLQLGDEQ